jgi:erythromycin esterase-like protein
VALNNVRDEAMAENVLWLLAMNPTSRIVVWMANIHAARSLETLDVAGGSANPHAFDGYHPTGERLASALGVHLYSVAITAFDGTVGNPPTKPYALRAAPEGSFESRMASGRAPNAFVDFRGVGPACRQSRASLATDATAPPGHKSSTEHSYPVPRDGRLMERALPDLGD